MESGHITLSRAQQKLTFPARFQLVAAMNPCPCGFQGDPDRHCRCLSEQVQRYRQKISGPLLDRIDLYTRVPRLDPSLLLEARNEEEPSSAVRDRVCRTRTIQLERQGCSNAELPASELVSTCSLPIPLKRYLTKAASEMKLSARAIHRSLRVTRTIADLTGCESIEQIHLSEALAYRHDTLG